MARKSGQKPSYKTASNTRQSPSKRAPRSSAATRSSKRVKSTHLVQNPDTNNTERLTEASENGDQGPQTPGTQGEVGGEGGHGNEWEDEVEDDDIVETMTVDNYQEVTKSWTLGRIRKELKLRRNLNQTVTPQSAHDEGLLLMREHEKRIAALALAARVSEHTLKKSMYVTLCPISRF